MLVAINTDLHSTMHTHHLQWQCLPSLKALAITDKKPHTNGEDKGFYLMNIPAEVRDLISQNLEVFDPNRPARVEITNYGKLGTPAAKDNDDLWKTLIEDFLGSRLYCAESATPRADPAYGRIFLQAYTKFDSTVKTWRDAAYAVYAILEGLYAIMDAYFQEEIQVAIPKRLAELLGPPQKPLKLRLSLLSPMQVLPVDGYESPLAEFNLKLVMLLLANEPLCGVSEEVKQEFNDLFYYTCKYAPTRHLSVLLKSDFKEVVTDDHRLRAKECAEKANDDEKLTLLLNTYSKLNRVEYFYGGEHFLVTNELVKKFSLCLSETNSL